MVERGSVIHGVTQPSCGRKLTLPRYRWNASYAARLGPQALGTLMRFPPAFIFVIATVGGYFVSVPLFRHTYGILPDGTTTHILRQKDADRCKAQFMKSTATAPPIPSEPQEVPAQEIALAQPVCDFRPPKAVVWDWFHLPRTLASHSAKGKESSLPVDAIGGALTSKNTWEIATGAALVAALFFLFELLGSLTRRRWHISGGFGSRSRF